MSVFISYKREDSEHAERIASALQDAGFRVWYDPDLTAGYVWMGEVARRLSQARAVVVCWSRDAVRSDSVLGEAKIAHDRNVIVPVFVDDQVVLPPPFNALHTESLVGWRGDRSSPAWLRLVERISSKADDGASLSDAVAAARRAYEHDIDAVIAQLRGVAQAEELSSFDARLEGIHTHLHGELFQLFVVGRMKTGKSTFINALLGKTDRPVTGAAAEGPLPVNDLPCTAVLTRLRYAEEPYVLAIPKDPDAPAQPWTFADYHYRARIRTDDGRKNEELFDQIREFHVGWPAELLRNGVTLVDSPGVSEKKERTELTRQAVREADAAIVVYRTEPLAGEDEIAFAQDVTAHAGNVFTLINRREGRVMDAGMEGETRDKLGISDELTLEQAGVYPVDLRRAVGARYRDDEKGVEASGLLALEQRLARFLISERYHAHVRKALGDLDREGKRLGMHVHDARGALRASADRVIQALEECRRDLDAIARSRRRIEEILEDAQGQATAVAVRSFQRAIEDAARHLPAEAQNRSIPGLKGVVSAVGAATIQGRRYLERTVDMLNDVIRDRLRQWSENPPDQPGLQADVQPVFERLTESLSYEANAIDRKLLDIQRRLGNLDPAMSAELSVDRTPLDHVISHLVAVALFGPLGTLVATAGWRGLVGGMAGGLLGTVVAKIVVSAAAIVLHMAVAPAVIAGIIGAAIVAGGGAAAAATVEDRLKKKALEQVTPALRSLATSEEEAEKIESGVAAWFIDARVRVTTALDELVSGERESLDRMQALSRDQRAKETKLRELDAHAKTVEAAGARVRELTDRLERVG